MSRKTKINVLLPIKMVGELESKAGNNSRSKFIQSAIRSKLDNAESFSPADLPSSQLLVLLINREEDETIRELLMIIRRLMA